MHDARWSVRVGLLSLGVFVALLVLVVAGGPVVRLDETVRDTLAVHRHAGLVQLSKDITSLFAPLIDAIAVTIGAAVVAHHRRRLWPVLVAAGAGWLMTVVVISVKHAVGRVGPYPADANPHGGSFPSGHTAAALVCLGIVALLATANHPVRRRLALITVAAVTAIVAAALVYAGFHWLSDCVASAAFGVGELALLDAWLNRRTASPSSAAGTRRTDRTAHPR